MAITDDQPTATPVGLVDRIERSTRRVRIVGWALALGWTALLVSVVTFGERESSYDQLEAGLRAGEVSEVQLIGELMPDDALGFESVGVRWRDGLRLRTATFSHATNERMARDARRNGSAEPVIVGSVEGHLASLDPDVRLAAGEPPRVVVQRTRLRGARLGRPGLPRAPRGHARPDRRTAPLAGDAVGVGMAGPARTAGRRSRLLPARRADGAVPAEGSPGRIWLTGGWAFLLALLLGGAASG